MRSSVMETAAARDPRDPRPHGGCGGHTAMVLLIKDKIDSSSDSLQEDWANPEKIDEALRQNPF